MKKLICLLCLITLSILPAKAQPGVQLQVSNLQVSNQSQDDRLKLTAFNLDFPGGAPADLVTSIEKATGKPLNVIIPTEDANAQLPPLKMNDINTVKLFAALETASYRQDAVKTGFGGSYSEYQLGYGFKTTDNPITDSSIWYFHADKPSLPPVVSTAPVCQFYQLQNYLNYGFTVDDITTAIQTGWKMAGISPAPELNYHKETHLLIAFGKPDDLAVVKNVLEALPGLYLDSNQWNWQIKKIDGLQSQLNQLAAQVSALTNSAAMAQKSSGK
ncbi:MAG TPA: hypothetical protein VMH87_04220 [Pseudomonadales bacterium]|nr:hypothetical protein [Pseudomonadales bacterium]